MWEGRLAPIQLDSDRGKMPLPQLGLRERLSVTSLWEGRLAPIPA